MTLHSKLESSTRKREPWIWLACISNLSTKNLFVLEQCCHAQSQLWADKTAVQQLPLHGFRCKLICCSLETSGRLPFRTSRRYFRATIH